MTLERDPQSSTGPADRKSDRTTLVSGAKRTAVLIAFSVGTQACHPIVTPIGRGVALICFAALTLLSSARSRPYLWQLALLPLFCFALPFSNQAWEIAACYLVPILVGSQFRTNIVLSVLSIVTLFLVLESTGVLWQEQALVGYSISRLLGNVAPKGWTVPIMSVEHLNLIWLITNFGLAAALAFAKNNRWLQRALGCIFLSVIGFVLGALSGNAIFPALALTLSCGLSNFDGPVGQEIKPEARGLAGCVAVLVSLVWLLSTTIGFQVIARPPQVRIVAGGFKTLELASGPNESPTSVPKAEFGGFVRLLKMSDISVQVAPLAQTLPTLSGRDVLVVINPTEVPSKKDQGLIGQFVRQGGRLLVLGDHTDVGGIMEPLNGYLSFTQIRFNFDSATPWPESLHWREATRSAWSRSFVNRSNADFGISIGASLSCGHDAHILVRGEEGFSDAGVHEPGRPGLGNLQYEQGEEVGGLALAAEQQVGNGFVQVWGDTSGFQDGSMAESYRFLTDNLDGLAGINATVSRWAVAGVYIAIVLLSLFLSRHQARLLATSTVASVFVAWLVMGTTTQPDLHPAKGIGSYDVSHAPIYPGWGTSDGTARLKEAFVRRGSLLLNAPRLDWQALDRSRWWLISSPTIAYSENEVALLRHYVEKGGRLIVVAGHTDDDPCRSLLEAFQVRIGSEPFGTAPNTRLSERWSSFVSGAMPTGGTASPIFKDAYGLSATGAEPLATWLGDPIAVRRTVGKGSLVVIGDSRFILDENLGEINAVNVQANRFLYRCLE